MCILNVSIEWPTVNHTDVFFTHRSATGIHAVHGMGKNKQLALVGRSNTALLNIEWDEKYAIVRWIYVKQYLIIVVPEDLRTN